MYNHIIIVSVQLSGGEYVASSPDEKAILEFARNVVFNFNSIRYKFTAYLIIYVEILSLLLSFYVIRKFSRVHFQHF